MPTTCTPQSLYGPYHQTRFCGASIMSFAVSAGWNEQSSELTVELIVDCSTTNKRIEYGPNLEAKIVTDADEFSEPHIGCAAYFRIGDKITDADAYERNTEGGFEFTGIIQSWNKKLDTNGNPAYSLKMTDPRVILDGSHIIVSDLAEPVDVVRPGTDRYFDIPNVINAYGWLESLDMDCRNAFDASGQTWPTVIEGTNIGSLTGGFGGAGVNERGMRWNLLKKALAILVSADQVPYVSSGGGRQTSTAPYSPYGRLIYRGGGSKFKSNGEPLLPGSGVLGPTPLDETPRYLRYMVDLSEIPFAPDYYRITGPVISFSELISQVCAAAGCDYYIELLPVKGSSTTLVIKVRVVVRSSQPKLGEIQSFVNDQDFVVSKTFGQELANQPNSIYIFGAKRQDYLEQPKDGAFGLTANLNIIPAAGLDTEGNPQIVTYDSKYSGTDQWWWYLDARKINLSLYNSVGSTYIWVSESELRFAIGTPNTWMDFEISRGSAITPLGTWLRSIGITQEHIAWIGDTGLGNLVNAAVTVSAAADPTSYAARDSLVVFQWLSDFAKEYYGKKFLIKVPGVCRDYDYGTTTAPPYYSDYPSEDGAWSDDADVLGLVNPGTYTDFFKGPEGKLQTILKFYGTNLNLEALDPTQYIANAAGNTVWARGNIDPKWLVGYPFALNLTENAWAQVSIQNIIPQFPSSRMLEQQRNALAVAGINRNNLGHSDFEGGAIDTSRFLNKPNASFVSDAASLPIYAGVPLKSHSRCYGPWGNIATASFDNDLFNPDEEVAGLLTVEQDEELAPWGYGSSTLMNYAAQDKVRLAITEMQVAERGQVTIPGYPNNRIGSSLNSTDTSSYDLFLTPAQYDSFVYFKIDLGDAQTDGASISNVNVNISPQGVQTELSLSTFSPTFGRFSKSNAERLKRVGRDRLAANSRMRANMALRASFFKGGGGAGAFERAKFMGGGVQPRSTAIWFCGRYGYNAGESSSTNRKEVVANDAASQMYFRENYNNTSIMTMDGLLRPVSKKGDGQLPKYQNPGEACNTTHSIAPPPPLQGYDPLDIITKELDPLSNPESDDATSVARLSDSPDEGHDWEGVARSNAAGMSAQTGTLGFVDGPVGYTDDYRFLALRGPLVIQGWGYDTHGHPVPNEKDSVDGNGLVNLQTSHTELTDKFYDGWLQKSKSWPAGPVDLRFDRKRGVWTAPPGYRVYKVRAESEIPPGETKSASVEGDMLEDVASVAKETQKIDVENITCATIPPDCVFLAYYDTVSCKYWPIFPGTLGLSCSNEEVTSCELPSEPEYKYDFIEFGKNLNVKEKSTGGQVGAIVSAPDSTSDIGIACSELTTTSCDPGAIPVYDYKFIEFGKNLKVQNKSYDGKDGVLVSAAGLGLSVKDAPYCGKDANAALKSACTATDCLVFGWGIEIEEVKADEVKIMAPMWIYAEGEEPIAADLANNLAIGRGLCVSDGGEECEKIVDLDLYIHKTDKCASENWVGQACATAPVANGVVGIIAGPGIAALVGDNAPVDDDAEDEKKQWVQLQSELKITDCDAETIADPLLEIQLGCGLKGVGWVPCTDNEGGVGGSTKVQIELDPMSDTSCAGEDVEVTVVCSISCSAEGIETLSKQLVFNSCGLFKGTKFIGGTLNNAKAGEESSSTPQDVGCKTSTDSTDETYPATQAGSPTK